MVATNQSAMVTALQEALGAGYEDYSLEGLWHAYWDGEGIAAGPYNQRLLAWLNSYLGTSHENLPRVMQLYAESEGFYNWSSITAFVVQTVIVAPEGPTDPPLPEQDADDETSVGVSTDTISFNNAVQEGNTIIVAFSIKGTEEVTDITDGLGNIYSRIGRQLDTDVSVEMWIAERITGGSATLTITYSGNVTGAGFSAVEIENTKGNAPVDYSSVVYATGGGGSSNPVSVTGGTPAGTYNLWLAAMSVAGGGTNAGIETPTGWTEFNLTNDYTNVAAGEADYKQDSTGTAQTASWSNNTTTSNYAAMIVALKNVAATNTTIDGEGEVAAIISQDSLGILANTNDLTSLYAYGEVRVQPGYINTLGDTVTVILNKAFMGGQTAETYLNGLPNRISNGTFDSDTSWTKTGASAPTISGGTANFSGGTAQLSQNYTWADISSLNDLNVFVYFEITEYTSGTLEVRTHNANSGKGDVSAVGEYLYNYRVATSPATVEFRSTDFNGKLDNVRVIIPQGVHLINANFTLGSEPFLVYNKEAGLYGVQEPGNGTSGYFRAYPLEWGQTTLYWNDAEVWEWGYLNGSTDIRILMDASLDYMIWPGSGSASNILDQSGPSTATAIKVNAGSNLVPGNLGGLYTAMAAADAADGLHWVHLEEYDGNSTISDFIVNDNGGNDEAGYILHGIIATRNATSLKNNQRRTVNRWLEDKEADYSSSLVSKIEASVLHTTASDARISNVDAQVAYKEASDARVSNIDAQVAYKEASDPRVSTVYAEVIYTPV